MIISKKIIDNISSCKTIRTVIWTGGECTLLGNVLLDGIRYAKSKGLASRVVSNANWATSMDKAMEMVSNLKSAGVVEINYSTGDNHQKYVPI